ncbi:hypothetical protein PTSG_09957 [Salpingoeca rosetta]|uniref:Sulfotransferase domain-containing protein n=1 Tax=Salpingoeca rosetta (strain ATCC 50818 / BSB-021) TaxID=946362 RepID=F2UNN1_SALR5|nr:uncharacterized protein PTSG_09957 [Salpingoeca rosetta]EGD79236.1 hypothetical protein PTSG_09957 [Salpingoeca rosetta]|eukprot:XP_004989321.1 hypothetical protein PTSG_09957 [Salpingoeca rosetta]
MLVGTQKRRFTLLAAGVLVFVMGVLVGVYLTSSVIEPGIHATVDKSVYTTKPVLTTSTTTTTTANKQQDDQRPPKGSNDGFTKDSQKTTEPEDHDAEGVPFQSKFPRNPDCGQTCCVPKSLELEKRVLQSQRFTPRNASNPEQRISYIKTHKTGSSTLGSIFFRYGARHDLTLYKSPTHGLRVRYKNSATIPADIVVYHYAGIPTALRSIAAWEAAYKWYTEVVPNGKFVTILREPISHYLSYYYFYDEPKANSLPLEEFVERGNHANILMRDFGVRTPEEMDKFMREYAPVFRTLLLSDRMHESLVILANDLGWSLWDMTYTKLLDSSKEGFKRWDGKPVKKTPKISSLDPALKEKIEDLTQLDKIVYDYAMKELDRKIRAYGPAFRAAVRALEEMNSALNAFCSCGDLGKDETRFCKWYDMSDMKYEGAINGKGHANAISLPFLPS